MVSAGMANQVQSSAPSETGGTAKRESESFAKVQFPIIPRLQGIHGGGNFVQMFLDFGPARGWKNKDGKLPFPEVLLVFEILVGRNQSLETFGLSLARKP